MREWLKRLAWKASKGCKVLQGFESLSFCQMNNFWCNGCGEPVHKCYCDEDCPFCDKKLKDCSGESEDGRCPYEEDDR